MVTALHAYTDAPSAHDTRTTAQRRAAALVRICEVAIAQTGDVSRPRAHFSFVLDWATFREGSPGRADGAFTGPIHRQDIERLLCECSVSRIVTDPTHSPSMSAERAGASHPPCAARSSSGTAAVGSRAATDLTSTLVVTFTKPKQLIERHERMWVHRASS